MGIVVKYADGRKITVSDRNVKKEYNPQGQRTIRLYKDKRFGVTRYRNYNQLSPSEKKVAAKLDYAKVALDKEVARKQAVAEAVLKSLEASERRMQQQRQREMAVRMAVLRNTAAGRQVLNTLELAKAIKEQKRYRDAPVRPEVQAYLKEQVAARTTRKAFSAKPSKFGTVTLEEMTFAPQTQKERNYLVKLKSTIARDKKLKKDFQDTLRRSNAVVKKGDKWYVRGAKGSVQAGVGLLFSGAFLANASEKLVAQVAGLGASSRVRQAVVSEGVRAGKKVPGEVFRSLDPTKPENWANILLVVTGVAASVKSARPTFSQEAVIKSSLSKVSKAAKAARKAAKTTKKYGITARKLSRLQKNLSSKLKSVQKKLYSENAVLSRYRVALRKASRLREANARARAFRAAKKAYAKDIVVTRKLFRARARKKSFSNKIARLEKGFEKQKASLTKNVKLAVNKVPGMKKAVSLYKKALSLKDRLSQAKALREAKKAAKLVERRYAKKVRAQAQRLAIKNFVLKIDFRLRKVTRPVKKAISKFRETKEKVSRARARKAWTKAKKSAVKKKVVAWRKEQRAAKKAYASRLRSAKRKALVNKVLSPLKKRFDNALDRINYLLERKSYRQVDLDAAQKAFLDARSKYLGAVKQKRLTAVSRGRKVLSKQMRGLLVKARRPAIVVRGGVKQWPLVDYATGKVRYFPSFKSWRKAVVRQERLVRDGVVSDPVVVRAAELKRSRVVSLEKERRALRKEAALGRRGRQPKAVRTLSAKQRRTIKLLSRRGLIVGKSLETVAKEYLRTSRNRSGTVLLADKGKVAFLKKTPQKAVIERVVNKPKPRQEGLEITTGEGQVLLLREPQQKKSVVTKARVRTITIKKGGVKDINAYYQQLLSSAKNRVSFVPSARSRLYLPLLASGVVKKGLLAKSSSLSPKDKVSFAPVSKSRVKASSAIKLAFATPQGFKNSTKAALKVSSLSARRSLLETLLRSFVARLRKSKSKTFRLPRLKKRRLSDDDWKLLKKVYKETPAVYRPSLSAVLLGIYGKPPKRLTGLELRPLIK